MTHPTKKDRAIQDGLADTHFFSVYSAESALRRPKKFFLDMLHDLFASRELAWRLFVRDLSAHYRQSFLGFFWVFLPPIASAFTFILLNQNGILNAGDLPLPYPAFVMIGTLLWQVFSDAVNSPIKTMTAAKGMLVKINFPREAILLSGIYEVVFNFLIRLILLLVVFIHYDIPLPSTAPLFLLGIVAIVCLGFAIGILLTPFGLLYADIGWTLGLALSFWMLLTPIAYSPPTSGFFQKLNSLNPVSPLIIAARDWLTVGTTSQANPFVAIFLVTMFFLLLGWIMYRLAMPIIAERMGG